MEREKQPFLTGRITRPGRNTFSARVDMFHGRNNVRKIWELEKGQLTEATDVDITDSSKIRRRVLGQTRMLTGKWRSIFGNRWMCLGVRDGDLVQIVTSSLATVTLRRDVGDLDMSYAPANDIVAYTNGNVIGYVKNGEDNRFPTPTDEFKLPMVPGNLIEYFNNRFYIVIGRTFFWTDVLSEIFGCIDKRNNGKQLASDIMLFKAVDDGAYISDSEAIYFASGLDAMEWTQPGSFRKVLDVPAKYNAWCEIDGSVLSEPIRGKVLAVATADGICLATNGGNIKNMTQENYVMPDAQRTAMLFVKQQNLNRVITAITY